MNNKYQEMVFSIDRYLVGDICEAKARQIMWQDIANFLRMLTLNEYTAVIYDDEYDIIVVQYEHDERKESWGGASPYWLTEEEYNSIDSDCIGELYK